jgi:hypothetical protein
MTGSHSPRFRPARPVALFAITLSGSVAPHLVRTRSLATRIGEMNAMSSGIKRSLGVALAQHHEAATNRKTTEAFVRQFAVPATTHASFSTDQLAAFEFACNDQNNRKLVDQSANVTVFGRRYYFRFICGHEKRRAQRPNRDGSRQFNEFYVMGGLLSMACIIAMSGLMR